MYTVVLLFAPPLPGPHFLLPPSFNLAGYRAPSTMKFSLASSLSLVALVASASAFAPVQQASSLSKSALASSKDEIWDPIGLYTLGSGEAFDTFPGMFPSQQYLIESETKHGRMAMLGWTGIWATSEVSSSIATSVRRFCKRFWI